MILLPLPKEVMEGKKEMTKRCCVTLMTLSEEQNKCTTVLFYSIPFYSDSRSLGLYIFSLPSATVSLTEVSPFQNTPKFI